MTSDVDHGIVITTGHFSPSAKTQAKAPGAKQVELVDGNGFASCWMSTVWG